MQGDKSGKLFIRDVIDNNTYDGLQTFGITLMRKH